MNTVKSADTKAKKVKTVTVNVKTVSVKAIDKAVKKAKGSQNYVTKFILGKKVKKISKKAFSKYKKAKTLVVKTKKLKKKSVQFADYIFICIYQFMYIVYMLGIYPHTFFFG